MTRHYDVVVCGAGVAGVAAAMAAARQGARTILIEKQCLLGGLATSGLIYVYLPLCDGYGHMTGSGIPLEMLRECTDYGPFELPAEWRGARCGDVVKSGKRCKTPFSPGGFTLVLDRMLEKAGVELWLDTCVTGVETADGAVTAVRVANDSGELTLEGKCFVDATGSAHLVRRAGGDVKPGNNFLDPWFLEISETPSCHGIREPLHIRRIGRGDFGDRELPAGVSGKLTTGFMREAWRMLRGHYDAMPEKERRRSYPVQLASMPQFRKIARIGARYILTDGDAGRHFDDSVGVAADWRRASPVWETPYRSLLPHAVRHVLAAGRCMGAEGDAWEVFRVIPVAAMTGEAAGTAAALAAERDRDPAELSVAELKRRLAAAGVVTDARPEWGRPEEV